MNKRLVSILAIIVILIGICITEQVMVSNYLANMTDKIVALTEFVKDKNDINNQEIYGKVVDLETTWDGYEGALCFLVNLKDIEDVGVELTKMKVYVVENNEAMFKASLALLLYYIEGYYNIMGISFENIF